jgi:hypothetical protein
LFKSNSVCELALTENKDAMNINSFFKGSF